MKNSEENDAIPITFELTWVLATLVQPNHIIHLCSGASLAFRRHATSSVLGISQDQNHTRKILTTQDLTLKLKCKQKRHGSQR